MRRLFWLAMGITIGALVVRKLSRAAEKMTPGSIGRSIADGLRDLADAIGDFGADVRAAAAEREAELRAGTGLDAPLPDGRPGRGCPAGTAPTPPTQLTPRRRPGAASSRPAPQNRVDTDADRRDPPPLPRALRRSAGTPSSPAPRWSPRTRRCCSPSPAWCRSSRT